MPLRGERSAPIFDKSEPNKLSCYFRQLETLFTRCGIVNDTEKKEYAALYMKADVAETWEALPEYSDNTKTFVQLKDRLFEVYNQVALCYILSDLDRLIGERQRLGMRSLQDLSEFHLTFNAMASYLTTNELISKRERSQAYLRVFDEALQSKILMRLQITLPNHHPSLPYEINDVYDAAKWVLQGIPGTVGISALAPLYASTTTAVPVTETGYVKTEELGSFLNDLKKSMVEAISAGARPRAAMSGGGGPPRSTKCMFDGCDAFIRDCPLVEEYIKQGKCRRNIEGKVILGTGAYVPRDIPGEYLKDKVDEWHRRNPNQLIKNTLFGAVVASSPPIIPTPRIETESLPLYQLSAQDRIAALECELFNLRAKHQSNFVPTIKTRGQRAAERREVSNNERASPVSDARRSPSPIRDSRIEEIPEALPPIVERSPSPGPRAVVNEEVPATKEHPFRNAKDATYTPPQARNVGAPVKPVPPHSKKTETAYRTLPTIHDATIANRVYNRALEAPITITQRELLSLSPEVRSQVRDAVSSKRIPNKDAVPLHTHATMLQDTALIDEGLTDEEMAYLFPDEEVVSFEDTGTMAPVLAFSTTPVLNKNLPPDALVASDDFDEYYRTLPTGQSPDKAKLHVAKESSALRAVVPLVNNHLKVESILDPGCQIIAMSEDVCHELALPYDPSIVLHMESANGNVDPSLGLARNVPFLIGPLTFYLQVHVIRSPAYDILLGRPFDVLTESVVRNFKNEDQTITLHDPNSGRVATIPTICRGPPRILAKKNQVFRK